jgi:hypothetical protein
VPFLFFVARRFRLVASKFSEIVRGGNSRLSNLLGCAARSLFDQELGSPDLEPTLRDRTNSAVPLSLTLYLAVSLVKLVTLEAAIASTEAVELVVGFWPLSPLGVFLRFQVTDFSLFLGLFSLCHFIFPFLFRDALSFAMFPRFGYGPKMRVICWPPPGKIIDGYLGCGLGSFGCGLGRLGCGFGRFGCSRPYHIRIRLWRLFLVSGHGL